ncbi:MAG: DHA2 family efflux MFS transporter permease subunit [Candidatus Competibacter denitrificans]
MKPPSAPAASAAPQMRGGMLALATFALGLGSFMNILDLTITNVSVPSIAGDLGVSFTQGTWAITSYAVAEAIMLPLTGWLAQRFGAVRLFVSATLLFTLASALCGLAFSFPMLLGARVMQGVVGASMIPLSQTLLTSVYPPHKRGLALGLWSMTTILGPIAGPLAGGWLTENWSWHWIFLINLPFGIIVALLVATLFRHRETPRRKVPVDFVGLGLLIVSIGALQIVLDKGNELDWFGSTFIISLTSVAGMALIFFIVWELTDAHPVVDLRLFGRRNFAVGVTCLMLGSVAFFGTVVVMPLWLQSYQGYTPLWAGKVIAFGAVLSLLLGPIVGANIHRIDARIVATFGFSTFALVAFWSARFTPDVDFWTLAMTRLYMGVGISCFFLPLVTINLSGLAPNQIAAATGLQNFMRNLGSSFGTAIMTALWDHKGIEHHARLVEAINSYNPLALRYLEQLQATGLSTEQALLQVDRTITTQSFLLSTNAVFCISGMIMMGLIGLIWWARPPFGVRAMGN